MIVDFVGGAVGHRFRFGGGRGQALPRAAGLTGSATPRIVDATAGLGRDAFLLASLGAEVTLLERSPEVHALLADGIARASQASPEFAAIVARMTLHLGDARKRVVLKWPLRAPPLAGLRQPSHQIVGKTTRYDVFMTGVGK